MLFFIIAGLTQLGDFHHKMRKAARHARRRSRRSNPCLSSPSGLLDGFLLRSAQSHDDEFMGSGSGLTGERKKQRLKAAVFLELKNHTSQPGATTQLRKSCEYMFHQF
jgi:hypothetical protein